MRRLGLIFCIFCFNLSFAASPGKVLLKKRYEGRDNVESRVYEDVIIDCGVDGKSHFTISLPEKVPEEGLPCIVVVGGLMTGRDSLNFIPDHGTYVLVAVEYPEMLKKLWKVKILWNLLSVRKALLDVPPQLIAMLKYLQSQPWMGKEPINVMGYSFGATFIPVTYVKGEKEGLKLGPGVMAYGGAGLYCIIRANLQVPNFLKSPIASIEASLFKPIDPLIYAPQMKGNFLLINGINDKQIPFECAKRLQKIVPEPKTIMNLDTGHLHPTNEKLTLHLINLSRSWVEKNSKP